MDGQGFICGKTSNLYDRDKSAKILKMTIGGYFTTDGKSEFEDL